jgi:hypothetical protein
MFATVRRYLDVTPEVAAELLQRREEVSRVLGGVPGLRSYQLVRTREGLFAVTVCRDEESAMEANRRAAAWLRANIPGFGVEAPEVWSGPVTVCVDGGFA